MQPNTAKEILLHDALDMWLEHTFQEFTFEHNNALRQTVKTMLEWLQYKCP